MHQILLTDYFAKVSSYLLPYAADSAYPLNGVLGVDYAQEKWGVDTKLRWSKKNTAASAATAFSKRRATRVWDVGAWYKPSKNVEIGANIYNIGNKNTGNTQTSPV